MDATVNLQWNGNTVFVDNAKMKFEKSLPADQQNGKKIFTKFR